MSQSGAIRDREFSKFVDSPTRVDQSAVETVDSSNQFAPPPDCDFIQRIHTGNVETYNYRQGGATGTILKTVRVTYTSNSLNELVSVEVI